MLGRPSKYPEEFRREAVELVKSSDRPRVEIARSLGISDSTLSNWVNDERDRQRQAEDPEALSESEREELALLRKEHRAGHRPGDPTQGSRLFRPEDDAVSRFRFVEDHQDTYEVKRLCELVECSRSGSTRGGTGRRVLGRSRTELLEQIRVIHTESRCTYGAPRVHGQLRRRGVHVGASESPA